MGEQFYCPQDCEGGGECGDGNCGPGEQATCPEDCQGGGDCGNGTCDDGENQWNCPDDCEGGGGDLPTCDSDADCVGGQTCVDLMGWAGVCLSVCDSDEDCGGGTCKEIGAFGFTLAQVCACAGEEDCSEGLQCCDIPMVSESTCMTQCMGGMGGF